jgi:hypothetical protein
LAIFRVQRKFLLNQNHDNVAVAIGHCKMHWPIAKFINDIMLRAHVEKVADERGGAAGDGEHERVVATVCCLIDSSTACEKHLCRLELPAQTGSMQGGETVVVRCVAEVDLEAFLNVPAISSS